MEMWNESEFTRIIRFSFQLFLSVPSMQHQWENVNLSQFIEFTKLIKSNDEQNPDYTPEAAESRPDDK
jgi:hypothetical protein